MKKNEDSNFTERVGTWLANAAIQANLDRLYSDPVFNYMFEKSSTVAMVYDLSAKKFKFISSNLLQETGCASSDFLNTSLTELTKALFEEVSYTILQNNIFPKILNCYDEYALKGKVRDLKISITSKLKLRPEWIFLQMKILETDVKEYPLSVLMFMTKITEIKSNNQLVDYVVHEYLHSKKHYAIVNNVSYPLNNSLYDFSLKEQEILYYLKEGKTSKQIAYTLGLSAHTVNTHRKNILKKTGATSTAALIRMLIEEGS